jgi:phage shock protein PspC (stress-responsive transcriptional regulator)
MEPKRLYRARDDRWIAGVCGGLGRFFSVDPTPIRLGFIVLSLWRGFGVLLYLIMLLVIPEEPSTQVVTDPHIPQEHGQEDPQARRYRILGAILLLGGVYLLMQNLILPQTVEWAVAVLLILVGFVILLLRPGRI